MVVLNHCQYTAPLCALHFKLAQVGLVCVAPKHVDMPFGYSKAVVVGRAAQLNSHAVDSYNIVADSGCLSSVLYTTCRRTVRSPSKGQTLIKYLFVRLLQNHNH